MRSIPLVFSNLNDGRSTSSQFLKDHRDRIALEVAERAQERRSQLTEQASILNAPDARIRIWEKVHRLRLPSDPAHAIVDVIAAATGLTLSEVRQEQDTRRTTHVVATERPTGSA